MSKFISFNFHGEMRNLCTCVVAKGMKTVRLLCDRLHCNRDITAEDHEDSLFFDTVYVGFVSC